MRIANYLAENECSVEGPSVPDRDCDTWNAIKTDLNYVVDCWSKNSYDVWEESWGKHYFNAMVQRRALMEGSKFALSVGDRERSILYQVS